MTRSAATYSKLVEHLQRTELLRSTASVLGWDEQTYMPPGGAEHRSQQLGLLAGLAHEWSTRPEIEEWISELEQSELMQARDSAAAVNIREARRDYDRLTKLPRSLVEEQSRVATLSQQAWMEARKESKFAKFLPWLEKTVDLKRQEAQCLGIPAGGIPYDALLDQYEPGMTAANIRRLFTPLREGLVQLLNRIRDSKRVPPREILTRSYPIPAQRDFSIETAKRIGFSFQDGRLDVATHPFCSGFGPGDTRLTTRYDEHFFPDAFFGTLQEAGHGIYDQGLDRSAFGLGMGGAVSLGIHESQSRMWENFVGRSRSFWTYHYPLAQKAFPDVLRDVSLDQFYAAINDVQPTYIRVEADEVTYNLHILLRFELEQPIVSGDLQPRDVPAVWNETFERYFGLKVQNDAQGCLQDIHWSGGGIGYFPTYTLGNMNAAQLFEAADAKIGPLAGQFAAGEYQPLKAWLNEQIHRRGKQYPAHELIQVVTGRPLDHEPLLRHLHAKFGPLYQL